jgi:tRNA pseudouridine synthase 10
MYAHRLISFASLCVRVIRAIDFCERMQTLINANSDYVEVLHLHMSNKTEFNEMKKTVSTKRKTYRCVVWVDAKLTGPHDERLKRLDDLKDLVVQQRTPIRVLHR